jgi:hypothetical protein
MSDLLDAVQCSSVAESHRIDPHVFCRTLLADTPFWFRVTDDAWYGWFVAQYPHLFDGKRLNGVSMLVRLASRKSPFFRFEIAEETGIVRAVFQLPIASEPRLKDDVRAAVDELADQWGTLLPFLDRIHGGEDMETVAVDAMAAFKESDRRHDRTQVTPPAACAGS